MRPLATILIAFLVTNSVVGQTVKSLKKVLELKIGRKDGANGAAVAWHPLQKKYYAVMAGNSSYPIGVFNVAGKQVSPENQSALFDIRGLWYNGHTKSLQMNGYNENGWAEYKLNGYGLPENTRDIFRKVMIQPDAQSSAAFNPRENALYFFNVEGNVEKYSLKDGIYLDEIKLSLGKSSINDSAQGNNYDVIKNYNATTLVFTGVHGEEIGLLNYVQKQVELYNLRTGLLVKKLLLPGEAPLPAFLNFSYANSIFWLFDQLTRNWKGYK